MRRGKTAAFLFVLFGAFPFAAPALAEVISPEPLPGARAGSNTELTFTSLGPGQGVAGFIANPSNPFDPVASGYPPANPTTGFSVKNLSFAGVLRGTPTGGGAPLSLYCIDILTETNVGIGYELGTWDQATVPNVGFVARLLNSNYPTVPTAPPGLATTTNVLPRRKRRSGSLPTVSFSTPPILSTTPSWRSSTPPSRSGRSSSRHHRPWSSPHRL